MSESADLDFEWRRACRADELLARFNPPPQAPELVSAVLTRIRGSEVPPDPVLAGHAAGFGAQHWDAPASVLQLQLGLLVKAAAALPGARLDAAVQVHTVVSTAAADVALRAWRERAEVDPLTGL